MIARKIQPTFEQDREFLEQHVPVIVLSGAAGQSQVVVVPALQGRVMTSTAREPQGPSYGWINHQLIASAKPLRHNNPYGGEDRFWIGPEGGQFSIFFKSGAPFDLEHWFTPAPIDTESFELVSKTSSQALLKKEMRLENYSGSVFQLRVDREIRLLERELVLDALGLKLPAALTLVAFESNNRLTNTGAQAWAEESGLLSIWVLGMFPTSPQTTIAIPFKPGLEQQLGPIVNDVYFGKVPADRLKIAARTIFFKGDGCHRSKIGVSPWRATGALGSYDAARRILTIVQYSRPEAAGAYLDRLPRYVNSMWAIQPEPYCGDAINVYNDGALPQGSFYELETSSPALALQPGASAEHRQQTFHFEGQPADLDKIALAKLGVSLDEIQSALL